MSHGFSSPRVGSQDNQIQRLVQKTGCDPLLCQEALIESKGSLLSALLSLEAKGQTPPPPHPNGGFFSTKGMPEPQSSPVLEEGADWDNPGFFHSLQHEILQNHFEIWHREQFLLKIPVALLILLFPITYGSLVFLLILPLFLGINYRFSSEGSFLSEFNPIVKRISNYLSKLGRRRKK